MKTAVITGASSGLGREFVRQFYSVFPEIERVWLIARRTDRLQELAEQLEEKGISTLTLPLDLCDTMSFTAYQEHLVEEQPEIALLVNNAGCGYLGNIGEIDTVSQTRMIDLNLRALTAITNLSVPYMDKGSRILNVSSIASFCPTPRMTVYSATKAYVSAYTIGAAEELKTEDTLPTPNTPYGISKLVAEKIHQIWQAKEANRELTIVRPGIVYGKGEHGNMTRLYNSQKKHYFFYAGRKDTVKACIYVKELVRFFQYRMIDHDFPGVDVYNCTFEPAYTIEQICSAMQAATGMKRHIPLIPGGLLMTAATILGPIGGKKVGIHPARVKKLMVSTNISGQKLAESGYAFHAGLEDTFRDWFEDCGKQGLY